MFARCPCIREAFALPMPHVPYSRTSVVSLSLSLWSPVLARNVGPYAEVRAGKSRRRKGVAWSEKVIHGSKE